MRDLSPLLGVVGVRCQSIMIWIIGFMRGTRLPGTWRSIVASFIAKAGMEEAKIF